MNSKTLVIIIMIISATLGIYIGMNQVSNQKDLQNKIPTYSDELISGDIQSSGEIVLSGDIIEDSGETEIVSGDEEIISRR